VIPGFIALCAFAFVMRPGWHGLTRTLLLVAAIAAAADAIGRPPPALDYGAVALLAAASVALIADAYRRARSH